MDTNLPIPQDYRGWAAFHMGNGDKPWPAGNYYVEIYVDGQLKQVAKFNVK